MYVMLTANDDAPLISPQIKVYPLGSHSTTRSFTPDQAGLCKVELDPTAHEIIVAEARGCAPSLITPCAEHGTLERAWRVALQAGVSLRVSLDCGPNVDTTAMSVRVSYFSDRMIPENCAHIRSKPEIIGGRSFAKELRRSSDRTFDIEALPGGVPIEVKLRETGGSWNSLVTRRLDLPRSGPIDVEIRIPALKSVRGHFVPRTFSDSLHDFATVYLSESLPYVFEERTAAGARSLTSRSENALEAFSGDDRCFRFSGVIPGTYHLSLSAGSDSAIATTYPSGAVLVRVDEMADDQDVEINCDNGSTIDGTVVDQDGKEVGGIVVGMRSADSNYEGTCVTTGDGRFRFGPLLLDTVTVGVVEQRGIARSEPTNMSSTDWPWIGRLGTLHSCVSVVPRLAKPVAIVVRRIP